MIGILTKNKHSWCSNELITSIKKYNLTPFCFKFQDLLAKISLKSEVSVGQINITNSLEAIIIRSIGKGSLEEIIFRMDVLYRLERLGAYLVNSPISIERAIDKFYTLTLLEEAGVPVPHTIVSEDSDTCMEAFHELGSDIVIKPLFGSRGFGSTRVTDSDTAERIFKSLDFYHKVLYLQEFIPHKNYDLRIFVLGDDILASMKRISESWKTNISKGAKAKNYEPSKEIRELALKASHIIGCEMAGIDILESDEGPIILELNSQPGWKGLQSITPFNIADKIIDYIQKKIKL